VTRKSETEKERKTEGQIKEKVSPCLNPQSTSAGSRGPLVVVCAKELDFRAGSLGAQ